MARGSYPFPFILHICGCGFELPRTLAHIPRLAAKALRLPNQLGSSRRLAFQNPHDRKDGVPVACGRRHTKQLVDLAKIANRLHVATVDSEDESVLCRDNSHEPLPARRKCKWDVSLAAPSSRQDAHESHHIGAYRLGSKRIVPLQADKIATVAEHNFRLEWQPSEQFSTELRSRSRIPNHERACGAYIHNVIRAQSSCENAWAKRPMSANVDTSEENDESHACHRITNGPSAATTAVALISS